MSALRGFLRSLSLRIGASIVAALMAVILLLQAVFLALDATGGVSAAVALDAAALPASIVADETGALSLRPTPALQARLDGNPTLRVGAVRLSDGAFLPGGAPEMAGVIEAARASGLDPAFWFTEVAATPHGDVLLVAHARESTWAEYPDALATLFLDGLGLLVGIGLALGLATVAVARLALAPLRRAAALTEGIGLRDLGTRVPERGVPSEALPFVRAVNSLLDRLDGEIGRQRRFVANAAHELRTPLSVLRARIDALPDPADRARLAADADRLAGLIAQMLTIARMGDLALPTKERFDASARSRLVVAEWAPLAIGRGRALEFAGEGPPAVILGNAQAFDSALGNLIDNALHAEPPGGCVTVSVLPGPAIAVSDHGPGLDAAAQAAMLEPFWRGDAARPGSGLGLAIVREAMRLHGGTVRVESVHGLGATVILDFTAAAAPAA